MGIIAINQDNFTFFLKIENLVFEFDTFGISLIRF